MHYLNIRLKHQQTLVLAAAVVVAVVADVVHAQVSIFNSTHSE